MLQSSLPKALLHRYPSNHRRNSTRNFLNLDFFRNILRGMTLNFWLISNAARAAHALKS